MNLPVAQDGFAARFRPGNHFHDSGNGPPAEGSHLAVAHDPGHLALFVIEFLPDRERIGFSDGDDDLVPDDGHSRLGPAFQVENSLFGLRRSHHSEREIINEREFLDQIIVREVRAHPGAHHHGWRNLDDLVGLRQVVPHFVAQAESPDPGFLLGLQDADQRFRLSLGPSLQGQRPPPIGGDDFHFDAGIARIAPVKVVDLAGQLPRFRVLRLARGERRPEKNRDENREWKEFLAHHLLPFK